jgi:hypothetical protein
MTHSHIAHTVAALDLTPPGPLRFDEMNSRKGRGQDE